MVAKTRCRALVAGFGHPGMRDLDFGRQLITYLEELNWPEGIVVEDLSAAAPLVLHRLQELQPMKLVLVGTTARGLDPPGTLRRRRLDGPAPGPEEVQRGVEVSIQGAADVDHTLALARHFGNLPADTVVIEVEPADCTVGVGFSEELAASFDTIVAMVRDELGGTADDGRPAEFEVDLVAGTAVLDISGAPRMAEPSDGLAELVRYSEEHDRVRLLQHHRGKRLVDRSKSEGLLLAGRSRAWGVHLDSGGDWSDVIPLEDGWFGVVMGDVAGRGAEAAGAMGDLRSAVRAYAVLDGDSPTRVLSHLDRLVETTGLGDGATLVYMALHAPTGEVRFSNAGHCPPIVLSRGDGQARLLRDARSPNLGAKTATLRPEATCLLAPNSTVLLFTDGLLRSRDRSTESLENVRRAVSEGPFGLDALCDHLLSECADGDRRDDDICLLALRLPPGLQPGLRRSA